MLKPKVANFEKSLLLLEGRFVFFDFNLSSKEIITSINFMISIYNLIALPIIIVPYFIIFGVIREFWKFKRPILWFFISYLFILIAFVVRDYYKTRYVHFKFLEKTLCLNLSNSNIKKYHYTTIDLQDFEYDFEISFDSASFSEIEKQIYHSLNINWEKSEIGYIYKDKFYTNTSSDIISAHIDRKKRTLYFKFTHH